MKKTHPIAAIACAIASGFLMDLATPATAVWLAAVLGVTMLLFALWQQHVWFGAFLGAVAGATFWLTHISWLTLYLGPIPWLALSTVMILWFAMFGAAASLTTHALSLLQLPMLMRGVLQALAVAGIWLLREQLQSTMPYGGFAWGRIAHSFATSPIVESVSWLGFAGLSFAVVFACALIVNALFSLSRLSWRLPTHTPQKQQILQQLTPAFISAGLAALIFGVLIAAPVAPLSVNREITVAAIQGNSKSGIFDDRENGDVFLDHALATQQLIEDLRESGGSVDVIVWPENSAEFQLPDEPERIEIIQSLSRQASAPIVVGTILANPDATYTNSTLVIDQYGLRSDRYDKRRPVPFAEYMPNRAFYRAFVPNLVDLVQLDYTAGTRSSVIAISTQNTLFQAGIAICFDIIFDDQAVVMSAEGAQIIFAQTNNADFGRTDESAQQLQIARLRAVEMGKTVVNISTVGTSAIVDETGNILAEIEPFTRGYMSTEVTLFDGSTPALRFGAIITAVCLALGSLGLLSAIVISWRLRKNTHSADGREDNPDGNAENRDVNAQSAVS